MRTDTPAGARADADTAGKARGARRRCSDEIGSGTVLTLGVVAVAGVLLAVVALLAGAQGARGRAQAGADLAALAAAQHLLDHGGTDVSEACEVAEAAARRNDVRLSSCRGAGSGVVVVTTVRASAAGPATARARAGPVSARG
ncbi:Rv3654c family TadE-like protein [Cellulomonas sp. NS3]|uniref:Rv3654c family TadE-like protein n=1 Tax=Cellulomonas sp. NS3 TaxID=2973977 RepID=UPI0021617949|nr:Rv3654c family TadE-like protein [Cellulomonas sp. NS3]